MKSFLVIACALVTIQAGAVPNLEEQWQNFKSSQNRQYESETEEQYRKEVFLKNLEQIEAHNKKYEQGLVSYTVGVNKFADKTHEELIKLMSTLNGYRKSKSLEGVPFVPSLNATLPNAVDWRQKGAVTPIKNQQDCGSCWAFSATGSLEGQLFLKTKKLVSLSEQNLVDCSLSEGNKGCGGGSMESAFQYVIDNGGIDTEESYPYEDRDDQCHYNPRNSAGKISKFGQVTKGSEKDLQAAVASVGPISVGIDFSDLFWNFYTGGIYDNPNCSTDQLDHGVLVVGYGTTDAGKDYWLVKNSWGESFGEDGYFRLSRNKNNQCGIATDASYPIV